MTQVILIGTLHHLHTQVKNYTYDDLYHYIDSIDFDVIGLELRSEDIDKSTKDLKKWYPKEMIELREKYIHDKKLVGFDWLGGEIVGKSIPEDYFAKLPCKVLEKSLMNDPAEKEYLDLIDVVDQERYSFIKASNMVSVHDEFYDKMTNLSQMMLAKRYMDTKYHEILRFDQSRNQAINKNVETMINENRDKKILVVTGRDHIIHLREYFKGRQDINLVFPK